MDLEKIWERNLNKRHQKILDFINHFTLNGEQTQVIECFTQGCCYWFAHILYSQFGEIDEYGYPYEYSDIYYDEVENHFAYYDQMTNRIYDITGDITNKYNMNRWLDLSQKDELLFNRLIRDCIDFDKMED